ncbi:MAG: hypothetical protein QXV32_02115 [Conexivisphaerales archaeon]
MANSERRLADELNKLLRIGRYEEATALMRRDVRASEIAMLYLSKDVMQRAEALLHREILREVDKQTAWNSLSGFCEEPVSGRSLTKIFVSRYQLDGLMIPLKIPKPVKGEGAPPIDLEGLARSFARWFGRNTSAEAIVLTLQGVHGGGGCVGTSVI